MKDIPVQDTWRTHSEDGIFGPGICELCGTYGFHPACEARAVEIGRQFAEHDRLYLQTYALHGRYGSAGEASRHSLAQACQVLAAYLQRPVEQDLDRAIEGDGWWFIPEGWIGMIGFIVEKEGDAIYPLGSGLAGRCKLPYARSSWCGIDAYLNGQVEAVGRSTDG